MLLLAGAATAAVNIKNVLPIDGFTEAHDDLKVRLVILESDQRVVIGSMDMTSLAPNVHNSMIELVAQVTETPVANVWLTLTHSFAGPHIFPKPVPGKPHHGPKISPEDQVKMDILQAEYEEALKKAGKEAVERMKPAKMGAGAGTSQVNISRNMLTNAGWTLGSDPDEFVYKGLGVIRIDYLDGKPAAAIYNYGVRSAVMSFARTVEGGKVVSGDLCEATCMSLEEELGCTALFLCGASADADPIVASRDIYTDSEGNSKERFLNYEESSAVLKALSNRLAGDVLKIWRSVCMSEDLEKFYTKKTEVTCQTKDANPSANIADLVVTDKFVASGEQKLNAYAMVLGNIKLGGAAPEIDSYVAKGIIDGGADMAVCMVNGSGKSMPGMAAYEKKQYAAFHSPYMPGTGELMVKAITDLLS